MEPMCSCQIYKLKQGSGIEFLDYKEAYEGCWTAERTRL